MIASLVCIDFEASSLENGYPTEVGLAEVATGRVESWLIRPTDLWMRELVWNAAGEAVTGITRAMLDSNGRAVDGLCADLHAFLNGATLVSDNPKFETWWLRQLCEADRLYDGKNFGKIEDLEAILWGYAVTSGRRPDIAYAKAEAEAWSKFPTVHRAGPDAARNAEMIRQLAGRKAGGA